MVDNQSVCILLFQVAIAAVVQRDGGGESRGQAREDGGEESFVKSLEDSVSLVHVPKFPTSSNAFESSNYDSGEETMNSASRPRSKVVQSQNKVVIDHILSGGNTRMMYEKSHCVAALTVHENRGQEYCHLLAQSSTTFQRLPAPEIIQSAYFPTFPYLGN